MTYARAMTLPCTHVAGKLAMYSGVLALGVGDSIAAVSGTLMGRTKWSGQQEPRQ